MYKIVSVMSLSCYDFIMVRSSWAMLSLAVLFSVCCVTENQKISPPAAMLYRPRTEVQQSATSVEIITFCIKIADKDPWGKNLDVNARAGSGVIVDSTHVISALHVVNCKLSAYVAVLPDGSSIPVKIEEQDPTLDLVRLAAVGDMTFGQVAEVEIGPRPAMGDQVCANSSAPVREINCGKVFPQYPWSGIGITYTAKTSAGNSGSPLYAHGKLIGITTDKFPCQEVKDQVTDTTQDVGCGLAVWLDGREKFVHPLSVH